MERIRVYSGDGRSFLLKKGETLRHAKSWANAYHKHYGAKHGEKKPVVKAVQVKKRKATRSFSPFGNVMKMSSKRWI